MDLLRIYHAAYKHIVLCITRDGRMSQHDMIDYIKDVAKFGNMIATRPEARATLEMANTYHLDITHFHVETISKMESMRENIEPCICLRQYINKRIVALEKRVDESKYDDEEESKCNECNDDMDSLFHQYEYWSGKQNYLREIYGEEDIEEILIDDEEKTDTDDE